MPIRSWAPKGSVRYNWLLSRSKDYLVATANSKTTEWLANTYGEYFKIFPWHIPDDIDPVDGAYNEIDDYNYEDDEDLDDEERDEWHNVCAQSYDRKKAVCTISVLCSLNPWPTTYRSKSRHGIITM